MDGSGMGSSDAIEGRGENRGRRAGVAVTDPAAAGRTGLQIVQGLIDDSLPGAPIAHTLNFWPSECGEGRAVFEGEPGFESLNPMGGVHGGWALTIIDSACGCATMTLLEAGVGYTTLETKANMTRAIKPDSGRYRCEATVLNAGRQVITTEARVYGPDGKLYAHGTSTCLVLRPQAK
jgi:uncharacterized protein (TIGR00369 family)